MTEASPLTPQVRCEEGAAADWGRRACQAVLLSPHPAFWCWCQTAGSPGTDACIGLPMACLPLDGACMGCCHCLQSCRFRDQPGQMSLRMALGSPPPSTLHNTRGHLGTQASPDPLHFTEQTLNPGPDVLLGPGPLYGQRVELKGSPMPAEPGCHQGLETSWELVSGDPTKQGQTQVCGPEQARLKSKQAVRKRRRESGAQKTLWGSCAFVEDAPPPHWLAPQERALLRATPTAASLSVNSLECVSFGPGAAFGTKLSASHWS